MDFLNQIAEYCSAYSTHQVLAALLGHSMFMSSSESGPAFSTLQVLAALPSHSVFSKSEFSLFCLWSHFRFPPPVSWIYPCLTVSDCLYLVWIIAQVIGLPLFSSPLDIVRRSRTHACPSITLCLAHAIPVCWCFDPACVLTTSLFNKACTWFRMSYVSFTPFQY